MTSKNHPGLPKSVRFTQAGPSILGKSSQEVVIGSPPFRSLGKAIWKGSHNPRSWGLTSNGY